MDRAEFFAAVRSPLFADKMSGPQVQDVGEEVKSLITDDPLL